MKSQKIQNNQAPHSKKKVGTCALVLLIALLFIGGSQMFFGKKFVLFSEFKGRLITNTGDPAAGVKVARTWNWAWNGKEGREETTTDNDGNFHFPVVTRKSFGASVLPHEPFIQQEVKAAGANGEVLLYSHNKANYDLSGELKGKSLKGPEINLVCKIDQEPSENGPFWGTCLPNDTE